MVFTCIILYWPNSNTADLRIHNRWNALGIKNYFAPKSTCGGFDCTVSAITAVCFVSFDVVLALPSTSQLAHCAQSFDATFFFTKKSFYVLIMLVVNGLRSCIKNLLLLLGSDRYKTEWNKHCVWTFSPSCHMHSICICLLAKACLKSLSTVHFYQLTFSLHLQKCF